MIVLDASAVIDLLLERPRNENLWGRIAGAAELHAPHLIDLEVLNVLRRLVHGKRLSDDAAAVTLDHFGDLRIERYPHLPFRRRIWALRNTVTAYDAAYVSLGEALGLPVVTSDDRLARSTGHDAVIESFAR